MELTKFEKACNIYLESEETLDEGKIWDWAKKKLKKLAPKLMDLTKSLLKKIPVEDLTAEVISAAGKKYGIRLSSRDIKDIIKSATEVSAYAKKKRVELTG